jgi:hypothetical protein
VLNFSQFLHGVGHWFPPCNANDDGPTVPSRLAVVPHGIFMLRFVPAPCGGRHYSVPEKRRLARKRRRHVEPRLNPHHAADRRRGEVERISI